MRRSRDVRGCASGGGRRWLWRLTRQQVQRQLQGGKAWCAPAEWQVVATRGGASTLRRTSEVWSEVAVWGVPQVSTVLCATAASLPCLCGVCRAVEVLGELLVLRVDAGRGRIPEALDARDTRRLGNLSRAAGVGIGAAARTSCRGRTGRCARVVTVKAVAIVTAWRLVGCGRRPRHGGEGGGDGMGGRQR